MGVEISHRQFAHTAEGRLPQIMGYPLPNPDQADGYNILKYRGQPVAGQHPGTGLGHAREIHAAGLRANRVLRKT